MTVTHMTARLHTPRGFVAAVEVPPFETGYPPLIAWGERVFSRLGDAASDLYIETFCYTATVQVIEAESNGHR